MKKLTFLFVHDACYDRGSTIWLNYWNDGGSLTPLEPQSPSLLYTSSFVPKHGLPPAKALTHNRRNAILLLSAILMWIPCSRTNTPRENVETPSTFQTSFLEGSLGGLGILIYCRFSRTPLFRNIVLYFGCGYHVPEPTRLLIGTMSKPLRPSTHRFWEAHLGNSGDLSCLQLATEPSPPHSADGPSAADSPPSGFPAAGLWKAPLDCSFDTRAEGAMATGRPPLSLVLLLILSCLSLCQRTAVSARVVTHSAVVVQQ